MSSKLYEIKNVAEILINDFADDILVSNRTTIFLNEFTTSLEKVVLRFDKIYNHFVHLYNLDLIEGFGFVESDEATGSIVNCDFE